MTLPTSFPYYVMDYIQNGCLNPTLPNTRTINNVFRQLFEAVSYLHDKGITHRDIKPENVLVQSLDPVHVVLTDFEFATWDIPLAQWCGTPVYAAPEIMKMQRARAADGRFYTNKVDVWSLGVMLLEYSARSGLPNMEFPLVQGSSWKIWLKSLYETAGPAKAGHKYFMDLAQLMLMQDAAARPEVSYCLSFLNDMAADNAKTKLEMKKWIRIDLSLLPSVSVCLNAILSFNGGEENFQALVLDYLPRSLEVEVDGKRAMFVITVARAVDLIEEHFLYLHDVFQDFIDEELYNADLGNEEFKSVTQVTEDFMSPVT